MLTLFHSRGDGIKFELDTEKAAEATVAIAASYGLRQVSEGIK
jgi:hypothetical protein